MPTLIYWVKNSITALSVVMRYIFYCQTRRGAASPPSIRARTAVILDRVGILPALKPGRARSPSHKMG